MLERVTVLAPNKAYEELRRILLREKCKIIEEDAPKKIVVEQGSWLDCSPGTYKKKISFYFVPYNSGTRIVSNTSRPPEKIAETIIGIIICTLIIGFLWWLILDVKAYIEEARSSIGGWLLELLGYTGFRQALVLINILEFLVFILVGIVVFGIISEVYCYAKREVVAEKFLSLLP